MATTATLYSLRESVPTLLENSRAVSIAAQTYRAGAAATPTADGTVTLRSPSGAVVWSAPAVVDITGFAGATIDAPTMATLALGVGYGLLWSLPMPDGVVHDMRGGAVVALRRLYPSITELDLYARAPALDPASEGPLTGATDFSTTIDEVDAEIQRRLIQQGRRPWLIAEPSALRQSELTLALALIFEGQSSYVAGQPTYAEIAKGYRREFELAFAAADLPYDANSDGVADSKVPATSSIWLM